MVKPDWVKGIFRCYTHQFSSDPEIAEREKNPIDEEDQYYQHFRDIEHKYTGNANCTECGKHFHYEGVLAKVPKGQRAPRLFCSDKCKKEFLGE